ncbi:MAG: NHL repeat-containing protein [Planctomycetes bacterium]|nr:NHL repeat-containing protein [Planctomycetota bacterium]
MAGVWIGAAANAVPQDRVADAVLGQPDFVSNQPNQPDGTPTAGNLAFEFAPHAAVAPSGRLYVSDSGNHRVLSWPSAATFASGAAADLVIGQPDFTSGAMDCSFSGGPSASGLCFPQGLSVDADENLWVADAINHRVLMFLDPAATDAIADIVLGQADFNSAEQNLGLGEAAARADSLNYPGRVLVRGAHLYVADSGNSRVLHYSLSQGVQGQLAADRVWGQFGDFTAPFKNNDNSGNCANTGEQGCGPPSADNLFNPIGIAVDAYDSLYVADWANNRVLRFDDHLTSDTTADAVFGQATFAGNAPNSGGLVSGLAQPTDVAVDPTGLRLLAADAGNNRVLVFGSPLRITTARAVFGQLGDLSANAVNHGLGDAATDAGGLFAPTASTFDGLANLVVVDTNNARVLRLDMPLRTPVLADIDGDDDVDAGDYRNLWSCLNGPAAPLDPTCRRLDFTGDRRTDLHEVSRVFGCFSGTGSVVDPSCDD